MQFYCESLTTYRRLRTREVRIGDLLLGNPGGLSGHPIRIQTMTTTDTMDTAATVDQCIRCIEAGAEMVRITAPSRNEAENLKLIKNELRKKGYSAPLIADIHFTPAAAEIAARIVEKVRINPGNYADKKKFEFIEYTDKAYAGELDRIRERFIPLVKICREYGTALRIGTNHGSLSDRIMSRYGDTPLGMVESAMEFLRMARDENYHAMVLSMKSSNPLVMVQACRLLVKTMLDEFGECYPLHLGVTEAGDGEEGRIKSAVGIGTLLEDGLGDTVRVSLTEDPELEIPVCRDLIKRYGAGGQDPESGIQIPVPELPYNPFEYKRRESFEVGKIGGKQVPVVIADLSKLEKITRKDLKSIGYDYDKSTDKWKISDAAADYVFTGDQLLDFQIPGTLGVVVFPETWRLAGDKSTYFPIYDAFPYEQKFDSVVRREETGDAFHPVMNFIMLDCLSSGDNLAWLEKFGNAPGLVLCFSSKKKNALQSVRHMFTELHKRNIKNPVVLVTGSDWQTPDEHLIHYAAETGALFLDGMGDGIFLRMTTKAYQTQCSQEKNLSGRNYLSIQTTEAFINHTAFSILQATRMRISRTEFISCPSCGRTLFDLQETTAKIRAVTDHLKGLKIAIMGCIVNGPGEMADADFGYVGSGPGKITLYRGKEIVKRNVDSRVAVEELINLIKENNAWVDP